MTTGDLRPAAAAVGAWLGFGAALDVALIHDGRRPMTHALRTPPGVIFLTVLCLHVADVLGPFDPFRAAARIIPRRRSRFVVPRATEACPCPHTLAARR